MLLRHPFTARACAAGICLLACAAPLLSRRPGWRSGGIALLLLSLTFWWGQLQRLPWKREGGSGEDGAGRGEAKIPGTGVLGFLLLGWMAAAALASPAGVEGFGPVAVMGGCLLCGVLAGEAPASSRRRVAWASVGGGVWVSLLAIAEYYGLWTPGWVFPGRVVGAFTNPNDLGIFLCLLMPVAATLMLSSPRFGERLAALAATVLIYTGLLMSGSRGAWWAGLSAAGALGLTGGSTGILESLRANRAWACGLAGLLAGVTVGYSVPGPLKAPSAPSIPDRFASSGELTRGVSGPGTVSGTSVGHRYLIWSASGGLIAAHPVLGVGPGRFAAEYPHYRDRVLGESRRFDSLEQGMREEKVQYAHNDYLQAGAEAGLPGLLLFIGIVAGWVRKAWKAVRVGRDMAGRVLGAGLLSSVAAVLVNAVANYPLQIPAVAILFWSFLGASAGRRDVRAPLSLPGR